MYFNEYGYWWFVLELVKRFGVWIFNLWIEIDVVKKLSFVEGVELELLEFSFMWVSFMIYENVMFLVCVFDSVFWGGWMMGWYDVI